ncbi:hypothetical protein MTO96_011803 [Rhipicephalus appendiculatus]
MHCMGHRFVSLVVRPGRILGQPHLASRSPPPFPAPNHLSLPLRTSGSRLDRQPLGGAAADLAPMLPVVHPLSAHRAINRRANSSARLQLTCAVVAALNIAACVSELSSTCRVLRNGHCRIADDGEKEV